MSDIPTKWTECTLDDYVIFVKLKGEVNETPYLEIGDVNIFNKNYSLKDKPSVKGCRKAEKNDIIISRVRPNRGAIGIIKETSIEISSAFAILRQLSLVKRKYLFYQLAWNEKFLSYLGSNCTGTMYPTVSEDVIKKFCVTIAPFFEQKRIVEKLDKLLVKVDEAKERLEKIPLIIKRFRQSVLNAAVTGELTKDWRKENPKVEDAKVLLSNDNFSMNMDLKDIFELPDKWTWCALGNYAKLSRGRFSVRPRNDPRYYNGIFPFIQIGDLPRDGGFITRHKQTLNKMGLKISKQFGENTIAIAIVGATIGNTGILSYDMCFPDSLVGIETKNRFTSLYAECYLRNEKENLRRISYSSGGQPNIKLPTLTNLPFPLPPLLEQKK